MNKKELTYISKDKWTNGQWKKEPDIISWVDPETGYKCIIRRVESSGHLCGYVAVDKNHSLYKKDCLGYHYDVHGGITYSEECRDNEDDWWIGFDCSHAGDYSPGYESHYNQRGYDIYRDVRYVTYQVTKLAKRLKEMEDEV